MTSLVNKFIFKNFDRSLQSVQNMDNYSNIYLRKTTTAMKITKKLPYRALYEAVLERRLQTSINEQLTEIQSNLKKRQSIQDHIFTIEQLIIEKTRVKDAHLYLAFMDLEKAFLIIINMERTKTKEHQSETNNRY